MSVDRSRTEFHFLCYLVISTETFDIDLVIETSVEDELINGPMLTLSYTVSNRIGKARWQSGGFHIMLNSSILVRKESYRRLFRHSRIFFIAQFSKL